MMTEFYILVGDINTSCDTGRQVVKLYSTKPHKRIFLCHAEVGIMGVLLSVTVSVTFMFPQLISS